MFPPRHGRSGWRCAIVCDHGDRSGCTFVEQVAASTERHARGNVGLQAALGTVASAFGGAGSQLPAALGVVSASGGPSGATNAVTLGLRVHDVAMADKLTFSGRASHFFTTRMPGLVNMISRRQARRYADSDGRRSAKMHGKPTFRLVVRGRTTGQPHPVMLMLVKQGDDLLVCGSQAGTSDAPNWWKNLVAAGRAEAQVGDQIYPVDARILTDAAERAEAWAKLTGAYPDFATYQALTDRVLPIAVLTRSRL